MAKSELDQVSGAPDDDKVFDVASPGTSMPSMSARPVISTHRSITTPSPSAPEDKKPDDDAPSTGEGAEAVLTRPKKTIVQPLHPTLEADEDVVEVAADTTQEKPELELPIAVEPGELDESPAAETSDTPTEASDPPADVKDPNEATAAAEPDQDTQTRERFEQLQSSTKYHVHIRESATKRHAAVGAIVLITVVLLAALYVLAGLEIISLGIDVPTFW